MHHFNLKVHHIKYKVHHFDRKFHFKCKSHHSWHLNSSNSISLSPFSSITARAALMSDLDIGTGATRNQIEIRRRIVDNQTKIRPNSDENELKSGGKQPKIGPRPESVKAAHLAAL